MADGHPSRSMVDGRWSMGNAGRFAGRILIKGRGFCGTGFIMQFLIFELCVLGGRWWMVDGRWWGFGAVPILIRMRGFCGIGFIMQFLIFELGILGGRWPMVD